jgi:hypothetical protein
MRRKIVMSLAGTLRDTDPVFVPRDDDAQRSVTVKELLASTPGYLRGLFWHQERRGNSRVS